MTAIEERPAAEPGKSIHGELSVDEATRATLPQLRYVDAVDAALAALRLPPDVIETGMRKEPGGARELFLRLEWLPEHDDLVKPAMWQDGLTLEWSHLAGWLQRSGNEALAPQIDKIADPDTVAEIALHAALCGMRCSCEKPPAGRWGDAVYLEIALVAYDERTPGVAG